MDTKVPLTMGTRLQFHYNTLNIPATIVKLKCKIHKDTGVIGEKNPKNIGKVRKKRRRRQKLFTLDQIARM